MNDTMDANDADLAVCQICLHLIAYGEWNDGTDQGAHTFASMSDMWGRELGLLYADGRELGFSMRDCDGCGDTHGGDRYAAGLIPTWVGV